MRDVPQDREVWEMTVVKIDGTRLPVKRVKGLGNALDYEEKQTRKRDVSHVESKRVE